MKLKSRPFRRVFICDAVLAAGMLAATLPGPYAAFAQTPVPVEATDPQRIVEFRPMRSFLLGSVRDDSDIPAATRYLYKYHVADSISQFSPYVTRYASYKALPLSPSAENFGTYNFVMTEHYWLINPFNKSSNNAPSGIAFAETYDEELLRITRNPVGGELRPNEWQGSRDGFHPTAFLFAPLFWEEDFKGSQRTVEDGPNYRWLMVFKYPDGVSREEGDKWFHEKFVPEMVKLPEVNRFISSRVYDEPKTSPFQRVAEIWFDNSRQWEKAMAEVAAKVEKPAWAKWDQFPFIEPYKDFVGIFLLDTPESNHLEQFRGYITTR